MITCWTTRDEPPLDPSMLRKNVTLPDWSSVDSSELVLSECEESVADVRRHYLHLDPVDVRKWEPVIVAKSPFVPDCFVEHLLRRKRDSALATKYVEGTSITNMEGALHTFLVALTPFRMFGDYRFQQGHSIAHFRSVKKRRLARHCVLSTTIHPDFEDDQVALALYSLEEQEIVGEGLPSSVSLPSFADKSDPVRRREWDARIKRHLVAHLTRHRRLPARSEGVRAMDMAEATREVSLRAMRDDDYCLTPTGHIISLEMLSQTYAESFANELSVLERQCSSYVYTYDPPAIFARALGAAGPILLNRVMLHGLCAVLSQNKLERMRAFVFNDYADPEMLPMLRSLFSSLGPGIEVLARRQVFDPETGLFRGESLFRGATLVLHNNSDAFGHNIETEGMSSLDGAIGSWSDAAARLRRERPDLTQFVL